MTDEVAPRIPGTFNTPFAAQVAAFRIRLGNLVPTATWTDLIHARHDRAFVVAGAVKADLLADPGAAVRKAIAKGTSLGEFRRDFRRIVEERGWHGWTGEGTKRGEAWRTRVIYKTKMATSHAAGRMAQLVAANYPLWVYRHGGSLKPRIQHLGWDGLILPPDHPFRATHAPPNGWGCSCYVLGARSEKAAVRLGGKPGMTLPEGWNKPDPRTGVPAGIDKGWAYAPGGSVVQGIIRAVMPKLEALPSGPTASFIHDLVDSDLFTKWLTAPEGLWPIARISEADAAALGLRQRVAVLSARSAEKQRRRHGELTGTEYVKIQQVIDGATEKLSDGPRKLVFILHKAESGGCVLVVKAVIEKDQMVIVSFYRLSRDEARRDKSLTILRRKGE